MFEKVALSNARFNVLKTLTVVEHAVRIPVDIGCVKTSVMARLKRSIMDIKAQEKPSGPCPDNIHIYNNKSSDSRSAP